MALAIVSYAGWGGLDLALGSFEKYSLATYYVPATEWLLGR